MLSPVKEKEPKVPGSPLDISKDASGVEDSPELNEESLVSLRKQLEYLDALSKKSTEDLAAAKKRIAELGTKPRGSEADTSPEKLPREVPPSVKPVLPSTTPASEGPKPEKKPDAGSGVSPPALPSSAGPKSTPPDTSEIPTKSPLPSTSSEKVEPPISTTRRYKINNISDATFEGKFDGKGRPLTGEVTFPNGTIYNGGIDISGNQDGEGKSVSGGNITIGVWKNGKLWKGTTKDKDGVTIADYREGKDKFYTKLNGKDVYRGEVYGSQWIGEGSVIYENGDRFVGNRNAKGEPEGPGKLFRKDGSTFIGTYKDGWRLTGLETKPNGARYAGGYDKKGLWSGDAEEVTSEGNVKKGIYREGKLDTGVVTGKDGKVIERYRGGELMVTDTQKDAARLQAQKLLEAGGVPTSPELEKSLKTLDTEVVMSPERLRWVQGDIAQKLAQSKTGVIDPSKATDTQWSEFLTQRNEVRKQMGLDPYPIISLNDFKISKPKNYLDHLARLEFVTRNTDARETLGSIVDYDHYFMSPRLQKQLDSLQPGNGGGSITSSKDGNQNILTFGKDDKQEQWNINELGWDYKHDGTVPPHAADANLFFHKKGDDGGEISFVIPASKAFSGKSWNEESIQQHIQKAHNDYLAEQKNRTTIAGFDLPKDRPVGFISVDAPRDNAVRPASEGFSHFFPDMMREQGYDIRSTPQTNFIGGDGVHSNIQTAVNTQRKNGVKDIYLQLNGHGNQEDGLFFNNKDWFGPRGRLTKSQFSELLRANPDMHFTINTLACHNAGLTDVMKKLPEDIQDRVTFFAGTKKHVVNNSTNINDENTQYTRPSTESHDSEEYRENSAYSRGPVYEQYLGYYLSQGKTYGEAHWLADKKTQENSGLNPEAVYQGDLYVSNDEEENEKIS